MSAGTGESPECFADRFSNMGTRFSIAFSRNAQFENIEIDLILLITTARSTPVPFNITGNGYSYSGEAVSGASLEVNIPDRFEVIQQNMGNLGLILEAADDVSVYVINYHQFTTDAFLALPCTSIPGAEEYKYISISYPLPANALGDSILIAACEDNTSITLYSTSNQFIEVINLNIGQTYNILGRDLTGSRVVSDKPVSFYSGHECSNVPQDVFFCDHILEQIPPTFAWGNNFLLASLLGRNSGETIRVIAARPANVSIHCTSYSDSVALDSRGLFEFTIAPESYCSIVSSGPLLVAQFAHGTAADPGFQGDPFMMLIPPIEHYSKNYGIELLSQFASNYFNIFVAPEFFQLDAIVINNNTTLESDWVPINCPNGRLCGYALRIDVSNVSPNLITIRHLLDLPAAGLGVHVYGFNTDNSYGYPGGLSLNPLQFANECSGDPEVCHENAICTNATGFDECVCVSGYHGDGFDCTDVNECLADTFDCPLEASCINAVGSFTCYCPPGFSFNLTHCEDIDECSDRTHDCDENADCTNIIGGFNCTCREGTVGDGRTCTGVMFGADPHFSVVLPSSKLLCYSVMGDHYHAYNLISNPLLVMNALFTPDSRRDEVTWIGALGVVVKNSTNSSSAIRLRFTANPAEISFDNKSTLSPKRLDKLVFRKGQVQVFLRDSLSSKFPEVLVAMEDTGIKFSVRFIKEHLDLLWHSTAAQHKHSHGLIGQFFRDGVEIDPTRGILHVPHQEEPVPVMRRPVWSFMEREERDNRLCWTAMNPGYQGKGLIEGSHHHYIVKDLLTDNFSLR